MMRRNKSQGILSKIILGLILSCLGASSAAATSYEQVTNTPIQHIVVVMQQNHTFDNYFGTYSNAAGFPSDTCIPISLSFPRNTACIAPFHIGTQPIIDLSHSQRTFEAQYRNGQMNGFVDALFKSNQDGTLAMGYYDGSDLPFYWNLADEFVLFDHYFSSAHDGSIKNRMYWVSGTPGSEDNRIPSGGFDGIPTIFDRLQERGISWKFYIKNYDPKLNYRSLEELDHLPPQIQWVPLLGIDRFLDDPDLSSRIVDLEEYYTDLQNGTLPAVSYVLLLGATEHPIGDARLGQRENKKMIQALMQSNAWNSSAFLIAYDDWGGWYDHVPPPQVDEYGYGFRVPALLIGPYARKGHVDHTQLDHTSVLKFIEANWNIPALAERDARANNFLSAFDFSSPPRDPVFVSSIRKTPEPRVEPRRIVIYVAYGSVMIFATLILVRASTVTKKLLERPSSFARSQEETEA
ncbi:MAG: alkaline phosphatase family protein [Anaerolineales bacterium]